MFCDVFRIITGRRYTTNSRAFNLSLATNTNQKKKFRATKKERDEIREREEERESEEKIGKNDDGRAERERGNSASFSREGKKKRHFYRKFQNKSTAARAR